MVLIWKLGFLILVGAGLVALDERYPEALDQPESVASLLFAGCLLTALIFAGGPIRVGSARIAQRRAAAMNVTVWVGVIAVLAIAYDNRDSLHQGALKTLSALQPGMPVALSDEETVLTRSSTGHFTAVADINGQRVTMLVDTGATDLALPYEDAERIGLEMSGLVFDRPVMTANGDAMVAQVHLSEVRIGSIEVHDVRASVAERDKLGGALLGMSFLSRLSEFSFRGDKLVLKQ